jgi:hypothetical protein
MENGFIESFHGKFRQESLNGHWFLTLELLRHSTIRSTLDVYTQAITPAKQNAQAAVMSLVFPSE